MSDFRHRVVDGVLSSEIVPGSLRVRAMRRLGFVLGAGVEIYPGGRFRSRDITLGRDVFVNRGFFYDGKAPAAVGDDVAFGPFVRLITATHEIGGHLRRCDPALVARPITIANGCWIGAGATILPGVVVAAGCVVAAGAVVTESTEVDGLYAGVPARRVRELSPSRIVAPRCGTSGGRVSPP